MSAGLRSKVRLPSGETEWFRVLRGVAQGAPESPWLYSNFINGLAEELVALGMGVLVGETRIPLLLYADDVVMLASNVQELRRMNEVATQYAFKHRFRFNGKKSAVMAFNANKALRCRVERKNRRLEFRVRYKYLGVDIPTNTENWNPHVVRVIANARNRSRDLLWLCRRDKGLRPRSAATLWKAIVRPMLEYAAELWAGDIAKEKVREAEKIQTDFARAVLGLTGVYGVPNVLVRAELGLEKLESRREKLRLGFWRRIRMARRDRAFYKVAEWRRRQVVAGEGQLGTRSWMRKTWELMSRRGLGREWAEPQMCQRVSKEAWKKRVYVVVEECFEGRREEELAMMESIGRYERTKSWERVDEESAVYSGEVGMLGAQVCEEYLDDVRERGATNLKLQCRAGCLPVMTRVMKVVGVPVEWGVCLMCDSGRAENIDHILLDCSAYKNQRKRLMHKVTEAVSAASRGEIGIEDMEREELIQIMMGRKVGSQEAARDIDHAFKRFLKRVWRSRKRVVKEVEKMLKGE